MFIILYILILLFSDFESLVLHNVESVTVVLTNEHYGILVSCLSTSVWNDFDFQIVSFLVLKSSSRSFAIYWEDVGTGCFSKNSAFVALLQEVIHVRFYFLFLNEKSRYSKHRSIGICYFKLLYYTESVGKLQLHCLSSVKRAIEYSQLYDWRVAALVLNETVYLLQSESVRIQLAVKKEYLGVGYLYFATQLLYTCTDMAEIGVLALSTTLQCDLYALLSLANNCNASESVVLTLNIAGKLYLPFVALRLVLVES